MGGRQRQNERKGGEVRERERERYRVPIKPQGLDCQFVFERSTGGTVTSFLRDISFYKRPKGGKARQKLGRGGEGVVLIQGRDGWMDEVMEEGELVRESVLPAIFN